MVKFVVDYKKIGRPKYSFDKYFRPEGLAYLLYGRATLHLPKPSRDSNEPFTTNSEASLKSDTDLEYVLLFLDDHCEVDDVDRDPTHKTYRFIKTTWITVHEKYIDYCKKMRLEPVNYEKFCSIRYDYIIHVRSELQS